MKQQKPIEQRISELIESFGLTKIQSDALCTVILLMLEEEEKKKKKEESLEIRISFP